MADLQQFVRPWTSSAVHQFHSCYCLCTPKALHKIFHPYMEHLRRKIHTNPGGPPTNTLFFSHPTDTGGASSRQWLHTQGTNFHILTMLQYVCEPTAILPPICLSSEAPISRRPVPPPAHPRFPLETQFANPQSPHQQRPAWVSCAQPTPASFTASSLPVAPQRGRRRRAAVEERG